MSVYSDREYRKRTAALKRIARAKGLTCSYCGAGFDWSLPHTHAMAFTADHVHSIKQGGPLLGELRPMHRGCNARRGGDNRRPAIRRPEGAGFW